MWQEETGLNRSRESVGSRLNAHDQRSAAGPGPGLQPAHSPGATHYSPGSSNALWACIRRRSRCWEAAQGRDRLGEVVVCAAWRAARLYLLESPTGPGVLGGK